MMPSAELTNYPVGHFCQVHSPGLKPLDEAYREVPELWHTPFCIVPLGNMHSWTPCGCMVPESTLEAASQPENCSKQQVGNTNKQVNRLCLACCAQSWSSTFMKDKIKLEQGQKRVMRLSFLS